VVSLVLAVLLLGLPFGPAEAGFTGGTDERRVSVVSADSDIADQADPCVDPRSRRNYLTVELDPTGRLPGVAGCGRLAVEWSPFGIALSRDGHVRYRIDLHLTGLDRHARQEDGDGPVFIAWALSPDLSQVHRIGVVEGGRVTGSVWLNQYLVAVTAEPGADVETMAGPIVIRGRSPTGWIEPFQHHDPHGTGMPVRR
jgi:hypothetical protein